METTDLIQTIVLFITILGLIYTIYHNRKQLENFNEEMKLNLFADYTKRYQEIMLQLPYEINKKDFDYSLLSDKKKYRILKYMQAYFDLCSEEYDLYQNRFLSDEVWKNWEEGIKNALSKKAYRDAWREIEFDTIYYPDFTKYINKIISKFG